MSKNNNNKKNNNYQGKSNRGGKPYNKNKTSGRPNQNTDNRKPYGNMNDTNDPGTPTPSTEIRQDPMWHAKSEELKRLVAALPFAQPVGVSFARHFNTKVLFENKALERNNVPGICTLLVRPSFGLTSSSEVSPINTAAWAQYSAMRRILAGTFNFDPNDVLIYDVCVASIVSAIVELQRIYGLANNIQQENRYLSETLIKALNFDPDDVLTNLANLEKGINLLINKSNSFFIPKFVELFAYHSWLYRDIYSEGSGIKDQLYAFVADGYFQFDFDSDGAGMAKFVQVPSGKRTVKEALTYVNTMIKQIFLDEDANTISSLLKKAYGEANNIGLTEITPAFRTEIVAHNDYILHMFKNATVYPESFEWAEGSGNLVQDANKEQLVYSSQITIGSVPASYNGEILEAEALFYNGDIILVEEAPLPSDDMVIESTRQMSMLTNISFTDNAFTADAITGSTMVTGAYFHWMDGHQTYHRTPFHTHFCFTSIPANNNNIDYTQEVIANFILMLGISKAFKYAPAIHAWDGMQNTLDHSFNVFNYIDLCDYDNYTSIDEEELRSLHEISIMSELAVLGDITIS